MERRSILDTQATEGICTLTDTAKRDVAGAVSEEAGGANDDSDIVLDALGYVGILRPRKTGDERRGGKQRGQKREKEISVTATAGMYVHTTLARYEYHASAPPPGTEPGRERQCKEPMQRANAKSHCKEPLPKSHEPLTFARGLDCSICSLLSLLRAA